MTNFPPADNPAEDLPEQTNDQTPVDGLTGVSININPTADVLDAVEAIPLGTASGDSAPDDAIPDDPAPDDAAPVVEQTGDEVVLAEANTSLPDDGDPDDGDIVNAAPGPTDTDAEPGPDGHYPPDQYPLTRQQDLCPAPQANCPRHRQVHRGMAPNRPFGVSIGLAMTASSVACQQASPSSSVSTRLSSG